MSVMIGRDLARAASSRVLASDSDREAWLAARRKGVTATEVKQLYMAQNEQTRKSVAMSLVAEKLNGSTFTGNRFTEWGQMREPVILAELAGRYGVQPCGELIHADWQPRHMATPDGWGMNFSGEEFLVEIKTSLNDKGLGSEAFDRAGYMLQMQWQMYCAGFERTMYVLEQHNNDWSGWPERGPEPGELKIGWVDRDEALVGELVSVADWFLDFFDSHRDGFESSDVDVLLVDDLARQLQDARDAEARATAVKKHIWEQIQDTLSAAGGEFADRTASGFSVKYVPAAVTVVKELDVEAAREAFPTEFKALQDARAELERLEAAWADLTVECVREVEREVAAKLTVSAPRARKK